MPNMNCLITGINKTKLTDRVVENFRCECREPVCPLDGICSQPNVVYSAQVKEGPIRSSKYLGMTSNQFIVRYRNHKKSFNNPDYKTESRLSKRIWKNKQRGFEPQVTWSIVKSSRPYSPGGQICPLCLEEKYRILTYQPEENEKFLNSREEIWSRCPHRAKFKMGAITWSRQTTHTHVHFFTIPLQYHACSGLQKIVICKKHIHMYNSKAIAYNLW